MKMILHWVAGQRSGDLGDDVFKMFELGVHSVTSGMLELETPKGVYAWFRGSPFFPPKDPAPSKDQEFDCWSLQREAKGENKRQPQLMVAIGLDLWPWGFKHRVLEFGQIWESGSRVQTMVAKTPCISTSLEDRPQTFILLQV